MEPVWAVEAILAGRVRADMSSAACQAAATRLAGVTAVRSAVVAVTRLAGATAVRLAGDTPTSRSLADPARRDIVAGLDFFGAACESLRTYLPLRGPFLPQREEFQKNLVRPVPDSPNRFECIDMNNYGDRYRPVLEQPSREKALCAQSLKMAPTSAERLL